jgi:D-fructose-responsive transcription factor
LIEVKSIADIAKIAGVAKTTVSAILNGRAAEYRISQKTCDKVKAVVEKYNYRPNRVARSLRIQKTHTIGLVIPDLTNNFFSLITKEIESVARANGYQVLVASSDDNTAIEKKIIENLVDCSVDGLIIASVLGEVDLQSIKRTGIPTVFIDREIKGDNCFCVMSNHYAGAKDVISLLSETSNEIAFLGIDLIMSSARERLQAYKDVLRLNNIPYDENLVFLGRDATEDGAIYMKKIDDYLGRLPKSFYSSSFLVFEGAMKYIAQKYGAIPSDLIAATFDGSASLDYANYRVHSAQQNYKAMAEASLFGLFQIIEGKPAPMNKVFDVPIIRR